MAEMQDWPIDRAHPDDAAAIAHVHVAGWEQAYRGLLPDAECDRWTIEARTGMWQQALANPSPPFHNLVALEPPGDRDSDPVAFAAAGPARDTSFPITREIYAIYVDPDFQRRRIGLRLFLTLMQLIQAEGHNALYLWCHVQNHAAMDFYEALGGVAIGEREGAAAGGKGWIEAAFAWRDFDTYLKQFD